MRTDNLGNVCPEHGSVLDCGHVLEVPEATRQSGCGGTGYGRDRENRTMCYVCCHEADKRYMTEHGHITAYLSSDGRLITGWPGFELARVTHSWQTSAGGFCARETITRVWARAADGSLWYGRGPGRGMYIRLHKSKRQPRQTQRVA